MKSKSNEDSGQSRSGHLDLKSLIAAIEGKNINKASFLATDYLNHFGEIIMLLEMTAMMPECLEDARSWQPKSYSEHFRTSGLSDPEIYVLAYENAPSLYRKPFDATVAQMVATAMEGIAKIESVVDSDEPETLERAVRDVVEELRGLNDVAASIIGASTKTSDQDAIDAIMDRPDRPVGSID